MRISRIKIQNFRNFADFEVNFDGKNIVIVGENNAGKTNLLFALRLLLDVNLPNSARYLESSDFWHGLPRPFAGNEIRITVDFAEFSDGSLEQASVPDCFITNGDQIVSSISYIYRPRLGLSVSDPTTLAIEDYEYYFCCDESVERTTDTSFQRFIPLEVLPALRDAGSDLESSRKSPLRKLVKRLQIDEDTLRQYGEDIDQIVAQILSMPSIANLQSRIDGRLDEMIGNDNGVDPVLGFLPTDPDRLLRFLRLFAEGEFKRSLDDIGTGYANIIYIVLLLLDAQDKELASEQSTMILAVEEPEAHLHPHLQRMVFSDLFHSKDANLRTPPSIITTHSPHIASVTPLKEIVVLKRSDTGTVGKNISQTNLSDNEIKDIERYLDVTRAELVFSKGIILVEGIAEQLMLTAYANSLATSLDRFGISIINVNGTDFGPYVKLLGSNGLDIPMAVVTDGDPTDDEASYEGLRRGKKLVEILDPVQGSLIDLSLPKSDIQETLAQFGIFVGDHTLEIDLLEAGYQTEYLDTFQELGEGNQSIRNTENVFSEWDRLGYKERETKIVKKIERICGKGRFAQRISSKLDSGRMPLYLRRSLECMGVI